MTSLNCFSYYVYISNILSFYYIIKLGSPTLFPTILKISIENFGHRRENQETRESRMPFIACTIVRNSRPTCTNFERRNKFSEIRRNHGRYFRDSSRIKDFTRGGRREGRKRRISTRPFCPPVKGAASRVLLRYTFFHHDAINLARICTPDRLVGITFRAKRPANIRCRSITTILLPA